MRLVQLATAPALLATVVSCSESPPKLAATKTGDLSNPPAERGAADGELVARCGPGSLSPLGAEVLRRAPYVQRTTQDATEVVLVSVQSDPPVVDVTTPEGDAVTTVTASLDPTSVGQWVADLTGLQSDTIYCYSVRGLSDPAGLRTAPAADAAHPVRFAVFGDSGSADHYQRAVAEQLAAVPFELMLHTGDVDYSGGQADYDRTFFDTYAALTRSIPAFPVTGNHDYESDDALPFFEAFRLPENGEPDGAERWFSFDWGPVHFVALDTEVAFDAQASWLARDLGDSVLPWIVVYLHRPPFSSGTHGSDQAVRAAFAPVFERYGVDVVLSGHEHDYERTVPLNGVTYVVTGGGGKGTRPVGHSSFTAFSEDVLHFVVGEATSTTMVLHAIDGTGVEFDSVLLER
jgi:hypothetical protein